MVTKGPSDDILGDVPPQKSTLRFKNDVCVSLLTHTGPWAHVPQPGVALPVARGAERAARVGSGDVFVPILRSKATELFKKPANVS